MADSTVELLFKLRAEADTGDIDKEREKLERLADSFGKQGQAVEKTTARFSGLFEELRNKGLDSIDRQVEKLTGDLPVVGSGISRLVSGLIDLGKSSGEIGKLHDNIAKIGEASGRSVGDVARFLNEMRGIEDAGQKVSTGLSFLGTNLATKVSPFLDAAAKSSQHLGEEVLTAAKAAGKSDVEIANFASGIAQAGTRAETLSKLVGFLGNETASKLTPAMESAASSIEKVAKISNLPVGAITKFLGEFTKLGSEAEKNTAKITFFGEAVAEKVAPELAELNNAMVNSSATTFALVEGLESLVAALGPVGIALLAVAAAAVIVVTEFVVATAVVVELGKKLFETAEAAATFRNELYVMSQQTNVSVETLSALELTLSAAGVGIQGLGQSLILFQRGMERANDPTSDMAATFKTLKITADDTDTAFKQAVKGLFAIKDQALQTTLAMQLFGRTGKILINVIKESGGDIDAVIKKAKELGIVVSEEDALAAHEFTEALDKLSLQFRALLGQEVMPAAVEAMKFLSKALIENKESIAEFGSALGFVAKLFASGFIGAVEFAKAGLVLLNYEFEKTRRIIEPIIIILATLGNAVGLLTGKTETHAKSENALQKEIREATEASQKAHEQAIERTVSIGAEIAVLETLAGKTSLNAEENAFLVASYNSLDAPTKARIDALQTEKEKYDALLEAKKKNLAQDQLEVESTKTQVADVQDQINANDDLAASKKLVSAVTLNNIKISEEADKRAFENGNLRIDALAKRDIDRAKQAHDVRVKDNNDLREQLNLQHRKLQLASIARQDQGIADSDTQKAELRASEAALRKADQDEITERDNFNDSIKARQDRADRDKLLAQKNFNAAKLENILQANANEQKALEDALATGDAVRKRVSESAEPEKQKIIVESNIKEIRKVEDEIGRLIQDHNTSVEKRNELLKELDSLNEQELILVTRLKEIEASQVSQKLTANKELIESELRRSDLQIEVRKTLNANLDAINKEQLKLERKASQERLNLIIEENAKQRTIAADAIAEKQNKALDARRANLQADLGKGTVEEQRITGLKIKALDIEETETHRQQALHRKEITDDEQHQKISVITDTAKTSVRVLEDSEKQTTEAIKHLVEERLMFEEDAAKKIIALRLRTIDAQLALIQVQRSAAEHDPSIKTDQLLQMEKDFLQQEIVLKETRTQIVEQGVVEVDDARQKDLNNERRYEAELEAIQERNKRIEHDIKEDVIRLMILHHVRRRDIIRAQRDLEIADEDERHHRASEDIRKATVEVDKEIKNLEKYIKNLKTNTKEEIEEHDKEIESLEKLRQKRAELQAQQDAETQKTVIKKKIIIKTSSTAEAEDKLSPTSAFDQLRTAAAENLTGSKFTASIAAIDALRGAFEGLGQAVGQVVQSYVLYGKAGASVRQVTAQILASVAQQAAVKAVFELAEGFAALALAYFGIPNAGPSASAHFTAAAIYGTIAGVAAIVGRGVAGDLFSKGASGGGAGGTGGAGRTSEEVKAIDVTRGDQRSDIHIFVHAEPGPGFNDHVVNAIVQNIQTNGPARNIIIETAGS